MNGTAAADYNMTVSLNVINHLGLNLYSNIPAVLSEAVANAWDADAKNVSSTLDTAEKCIVITDDGHGGRSDEQVLVVFLVGTEPLGWEDASYRQRDVDSLRVKNMRVLSYQELLTNARRVYGEYLVQRQETGRIQKLLQEIDTADLLPHA
jgi:hypothetical protein